MKSKSSRPARAVGFGVCLTAALVFASVLASAPAAQPNPAVNDGHDFVFLAEARPILVRVHVRVDGMPLQAGWDGFMQYLFANLDVNGDGFLSKEEAERAPSVDQIVSGNPTPGFGGFGGMGGAPARPTMAELDLNKDGKVSYAELTAYYRKHGFVPFQFQHDSKQPNPFTMAFGGNREPSVQDIGDAIFTLLDTNGDGKLSKEELAAAPSVLLRLDTNDDEMIVPRELVPYVAKLDQMQGMQGMMGMGPKGPGAAAENNQFVLIESPGMVPSKLMRFLQERYCPPGDQPGNKKLSRKNLGLDEATFAALDTNGNGVLDEAELAGFVKRPPDVELVIQLGAGLTPEARMALAPGKAAPLAPQLKIISSVALLDLGVTRVELRGSDAERQDRLGGLLRQQYVAQFKQADKAGKGYLDEQQAEASPLFKGLFRAMDRDGDGKVYEKELIAYLDQLAELKKRGRAACVTMVLSDQSRGLFDLLDLNRDGRLSVREMRGAVKLLERLGPSAKGFLTKADMPRSYLLTLRRGGATGGGFDFTSALEDLYGGYEASDGDYATAGPLWFQKMDRNRDGDVSRKEFLGTDEQFRQIDTDGDGLISLEEAQRFDALNRKKK
jgi:Ca2+-binding EF-hand superfamily protein